MRYVMIVDIDDALLEGDESIEHATSVLMDFVDVGSALALDVTDAVTFRPLSEEIAC